MKPVNVRSEDDEDRDDGTERLHALQHVAAGDLMDEFLEETKRQLLRDHVSHEKCPALRLDNRV